MNMKKIGLLLSGLLMAFVISAQNLPEFTGKDKFTNEAEFSLTQSKTKDICVGDVITLTFKGKINVDGWHLYSSRDDGNISYNATMLDVFDDESKGAKKRGKMSENKKPDEREDELMGGTIREFHDKEVKFSQKIEITSSDVHIVAEFSAQTCTSAGMCKFLKLPFEWKFTAKECSTGAVEPPVENVKDPKENLPEEVQAAVDAPIHWEFLPYDSSTTLSKNVGFQKVAYLSDVPVSDSGCVERFYHPGQAKAYAEATGRPMLFFFSKINGCEKCDEIEEKVFKDEKVNEILRNRVVVAEFNTDDVNGDTKDLAMKDGKRPTSLGSYFDEWESSDYGGSTQPLLLLADASGKELARSAGSADPAVVAKMLEGGIGDFYAAKGIAEPSSELKAATVAAAEGAGGAVVAAPDEKASDCSPSTLLSTFGVAFIAGLFAILTPCVFPMVPMTVSFFLKSGEDEGGKSKGIRNGLIYMFSIIFIYGGIGLLISVLFGPTALYTLGSHPIPNFIFFLIFFIFALSFLGMFEITLPSSWSSAMNSKAGAGGFLGPFFMALTLVIVSFSCTGPILGAAVVGSTQGTVCTWKPFMSFLGFGVAFGIPFGLLAMAPKLMEKLPMAGGWMNTVKVVFGFLELALCMKFLSNVDQVTQWGILDRQLFIGIWIVIFALLGLYFLGWIILPHDEKQERISVPRLLMGIASLSFTLYLVPGLWGGPLSAMEGLLPPSNKGIGVKLLPHQVEGAGGGTATLNSEICKTTRVNAHIGIDMETHGFCMFYDFEQGMAFAKEKNMPVFLDFTGHTCANCRKMEQDVWPDDAVRELLLKEYVMISMYADDETKFETPKVTPDGKKLRTVGDWTKYYQGLHYGTVAQPYYVLMDHDESSLNTPKGYTPDIATYVNFLKEGVEAFNKKHGTKGH